MVWQEIVFEKIDDALAKVFPIVLLKMISEYTVSSNGCRLESWPVLTRQPLTVRCLDGKLYTNSNGFSIISYNDLKDKQRDWQKQEGTYEPIWFSQRNIVVTTKESKDLWCLVTNEKGAIFRRTIIDANGSITSQTKPDVILKRSYCDDFTSVESKKQIWFADRTYEGLTISVLNSERPSMMIHITERDFGYGSMAFDGHNHVWIVDEKLSVVRYNVNTFCPASGNDLIQKILRDVCMKDQREKVMEVSLVLVNNEMWIFLESIGVICVFDSDGSFILQKKVPERSYHWHEKPFVVQNEVFFFSSSATQLVLNRIY